MQDFVTILQNFGVPVACLVALGVFSSKMVTKIFELTERVTSAMVENSSNMATLSQTIDKLLTYIHEKENKNDRQSD